MSIRTEDKEFLNGMVAQLDETIKNLELEEKEVAVKLGANRVEELKEFWNQDLSEEEEKFFKMTLDYWDKKLIQIWARTKRVRHTRAEVGRTFIKKAVLINHNRLET
jgi:hypothetical protein